MHSLIVDIIQRFGGRLAGSPQEDQAQDYLKGVLNGFCDKTYKHRFRAPLTAMHDSLKLFSIGFWASLVLYWISLPLAFILAAVNAMFFVWHFMSYRYKLDFLFPQQESSNVIGVIEPQEDVRSTLIFAGHMDSTTEYKWWWRLKSLGTFLSGLSGFLFVILPVYFLLELFAGRTLGWFIFLLLSPAVITMYSMRSDSVVLGAQDNLSGIVTAVGAARALAAKDGGEPALKHTRIIAASFGSEEAGLRGAAAFVEDFKDMLEATNAHLINMDGIMRTRDLVIVRGELNPWAWHSRDLVDGLKKAFLQCSLKPRTGVLPIGATDAAAFTIRGLPAVTIIGQSITHPDPTYHTRLDLPEFVEPQALEAVRDVLTAFAKRWDQTMEEADQ